MVATLKALATYAFHFSGWLHWLCLVLWGPSTLLGVLFWFSLNPSSPHPPPTRRKKRRRKKNGYPPNVAWVLLLAFLQQTPTKKKSRAPSNQKTGTLLKTKNWHPPTKRQAPSNKKNRHPPNQSDRPGPPPLHQPPASPQPAPPPDVAREVRRGEPGDALRRPEPRVNAAAPWWRRRETGDRPVEYEKSPRRPEKVLENMSKGKNRNKGTE